MGRSIRDCRHWDVGRQQTGETAKLIRGDRLDKLEKKQRYLYSSSILRRHRQLAEEFLKE